MFPEQDIIRELYRHSHALLIYAGIFDNSIGQAFLKLLKSLLGNPEHDPLGIDSLKAYGEWFRLLANTGHNWQDWLVEQILVADNPFSQQVQNSSLQQLSPSLIESAKHDLNILERLYKYPVKNLSKALRKIAHLEKDVPFWENQSPPTGFLHKQENWGELLKEIATHYRENGVGIMGIYGAFHWENTELKGINCPDFVRLNALVGYEDQKQTLIKNTEFLLAGYPALNVLLYGSRGTGKSSLVKALLNEYRHRGLRLIEVYKSALKDLPIILDRLRTYPQKFILFVDDLSFEEDDNEFKSLKVVLEGSVTAKADNVVVYATSNRRHLVREFFSDRPQPSQGEEVHAWDTLQEKLSFSDRFGLTLTFEPPNQDTYLEIVEHLAQQAQIQLPTGELSALAKQWAIRHHGRSGRSAKQFIDFLQGELAFGLRESPDIRHLNVNKS